MTKSIFFLLHTVNTIKTEVHEDFKDFVLKTEIPFTKKYIKNGAFRWDKSITGKKKNQDIISMCIYK